MQLRQLALLSVLNIAFVLMITINSYYLMSVLSVAGIRQVLIMIIQSFKTLQNQLKNQKKSRNQSKAQNSGQKGPGQVG